MQLGILNPGHFLMQLGVLAPGRVVTYNGAWWSLQVEIVFYLLLPAAAWFFSRPRVASGPLSFGLLLVLFAAAAVCSTRIEAMMQSDSPTLLYFVAYSPCFVMGMFLARFDVPRRWAYACWGWGPWPCWSALQCLRARRPSATGFRTCRGTFTTDCFTEG